jgi:hypothetical protein
MDDAKILDRKYEAIGWGLLLIWWGLRWSLLSGLPEGSGLIGTGLLFLGIAVVRSMNGLPTSGSTKIIGILALVWGGLELVNSTSLLAVKLPVFEILLIVLGGILLANGLRQPRPAGLGEGI